MTPLKGDIVLVQGVDPETRKGRMFPRIIAHCQRNVSENYTDYEASWTHAGIVEQWGPVIGTGRANRVIEARGFKGVTKGWYDHEPRRFVVLRYACVVTDRDRDAIVRSMDAMVGDPYSWRDVTLLLLRHWCHRLRHMPFDESAHEFCSEAVAVAYDHAGLTLPTAVAPAAMWPAEIARLWLRGALYCVYDSRPADTTEEITGELFSGAVSHLWAPSPA